jgi:hypothetical protein
MRTALAALLWIALGATAFAQLADVPAALARISPEAASLEFARGDFKPPSGGHLQGVQIRFDARRDRHFVYLSHDSATAAYLAIVEFPAELTAPGRLIHVHTLPSDGAQPPLRHAGGIQLAGDVLAVGLEDNQQKTRSEVQFWDVADPAKLVQLEHLTIRRSGAPKDKTAGAVGIIKRKGDHLLAVANWDSRAVDFYVSNGKPPADPACRFEFEVRWRDAAADKSAWQPDATFGRYQATNLLVDAAGNVFLVGFPTAATSAVDLYAVDLTGEPSRILRKLVSKPMRLPAGNRFQFAGGLSLLDDRAVILSSPSALTNRTTLGLAR